MPSDFNDFERVSYPRGLDEDLAIKRLIDGDFTFGDEAPLLEAIQRGMRLPMSLNSIMNVLVDCMDGQVSVDEAKRRLIEAA